MSKELIIFSDLFSNLKRHSFLLAGSERYRGPWHRVCSKIYIARSLRLNSAHLCSLSDVSALCDVSGTCSPDIQTRSWFSCQPWAWALKKSLTRPSFFLYFREIRKKQSHWPGSQSALRLYNCFNLCPCSPKQWKSDACVRIYISVSARSQLTKSKQTNYRECSSIKLQKHNEELLSHCSSVFWLVKVSMVPKQQNILHTNDS